MKVRRQRGRVLRAPDLQFGGPQFNPALTASWICSCSPEFKSLAMLVNSQLAGLVMFYLGKDYVVCKQHIEMAAFHF